MVTTPLIASVEPLEGRRLLAAGDLDPTFGRGGVVLPDPTTHRGGAAAVALQPDGKIVSGGTFEPERQGPVHFALLRYNADGSTDRSFGADGYVTANPAGADRSFISDVAVQADGRILAAGWAHVGG